MKKRLLITLSLLISYAFALGQETGDLASEYFKKGEYDKAATEYAQTLKKNVAWPNVFRYVYSLKKTNRTEEAVKYIRRQTKTDGANRAYYDLLNGYISREQGDTTAANQQFDRSVEESKQMTDGYARVATAFIDIQELPWAIKTYAKARVAAKDERLYSEELVDLYRAAGQTDKWLDELLTLGQRADRKEVVVSQLQTLINSKDEPKLEAALYARVQRFPNEFQYSELLSWFFVQKQKFGRALLQEKALDKRMHLNGTRVYELGQLALNNREYKAAVEAFDYLVVTYPQGQLYPLSRRMAISAREEDVKNTYPVDINEIHKLINSYQKLFSELGTNTKTLEALRSTANLYAYYLDEKDSALTALDLASELGKNDRNFLDRCKLDKGDIYILKGEPWESTLLYAQVEKSQKEEQLGYEAKLKSAKLYYYKGEFTLSKAVLDILKLATSREIANDAEQLSLIIQDNTGLDTSETAMREYAAVDLLLFQNKTDRAINELNRMQTKYKDHSLADEIMWLRANTYLKQGRDDEALADLKNIVANYSKDILGDDAMFLEAKILEERKKDKAAAMDLYQKFLVAYPGSIYGADARKRFRLLRGDVVN